MNMKRFFLYLAAVVCLASCNNKDTLWMTPMSDIDARVTYLEQLCMHMNTNIASMQTIIQALQERDYVTNVAEIKEGNEVIGYTITFAKNPSITIYKGNDGKDGKDGEDGITPQIGVAKDGDVYYWTLNGEWLLDANGNKLRVTGENGKDGKDGKDGVDGENGQDGKDGEDGQDGTNGQDGITPKLKIENDYWYISYDNGTTWNQLGKAKGDKGETGATGAAGKDGQDGKDGDSMFKSVTQDDTYVYFTLADDSVIKINKLGSDFDQTIIDNLVTSISLNHTLIYMYVGEDTTLVATTKPFANSKVTWTASSTDASVDANGHIVANSTGVVTISAKAADKGSSCTLVIMDESLQNQMSASDTKKIQFAHGNLKYTKSSHAFSFMQSQYSYVGETTFSYETFTDMDLFGFGTSGYSYHGGDAGCFDPWSTVTRSNNYAKIADGTINGTNMDWGVYNVIGNDPAGTWRTPTQNELKYILNNRPC
ncbi:MAG: Ig-like domain-containing protein, partial [Bacteroidales bacterium]|nr:Ig-like domain-containing protein [Bacteroidales bacterium]